jgi:hypothetical protein
MLRDYGQSSRKFGTGLLEGSEQRKSFMNWQQGVR